MTPAERDAWLAAAHRRHRRLVDRVVEVARECGYAGRRGRRRATISIGGVVVHVGPVDAGVDIHRVTVSHVWQLTIAGDELREHEAHCPTAAWIVLAIEARLARWPMPAPPWRLAISRPTYVWTRRALASARASRPGGCVALERLVEAA